MHHTSHKWTQEYQKKEALFIHDGNSKHPHALLTFGKHSNGFFNSRLVIPDEALLSDASSDLLELFKEQGGDISKVQGVVGPQTGATKIAELLSNKINTITGGECFFASPKKQESDGKKSMVFSVEEMALLSNKSILLCEDVITTGGSINLTVDAVNESFGKVLPFILVLVNRSGLTHIDGRKIIALIDRAMPMWAPDECPLCMGGSDAVRPKENWAELNAKY